MMNQTIRTLVLASIFGLGSGLMLPPSADALQQSKPLSTDKRLHTYVYNKNEVYKFKGHYGYQSVIEF